eukprot:8213193-Pyramimonas_sp.AAC.1
MECVPRRIMPDGAARSGCVLRSVVTWLSESRIYSRACRPVCVCVSERIANSLRGSVMPKGLGGKFVSLPGKEMAALRASGRGVFST